jgi:membrane protein
MNIDIRAENILVFTFSINIIVAKPRDNLINNYKIPIIIYTYNHMLRSKYSKFKNLTPVFIVMETYKNWRKDRTLRLGAGLAYYGVFTIVPILTLMIGFATYFFSTQDITLFAQETFNRIFTSELSEFLSNLVTSITRESAKNEIAISSIISLGVLVAAGSLIFVAFQDALDTIWHKPLRLGWKKWLKKYLWAYIVVMIVSLILLAVLTINAIGNIAINLLPGQFSILENFANFLVSVSTWLLGIIVLTIIYKVLISHKISWRIIIFSSTITTVLVVIGTSLLGLYISNFAGGSLSGAVGAILLLLVWVYYEAQIILVGAQLIKTLDENKSKLPNVLK